MTDARPEKTEKEGVLRKKEEEGTLGPKSKEKQDSFFLPLRTHSPESTGPREKGETETTRRRRGRGVTRSIFVYFSTLSVFLLPFSHEQPFTTSMCRLTDLTINFVNGNSSSRIAYV